MFYDNINSVLNTIIVIIITVFFTAKVKGASKVVRNVRGVIRLLAAPHYGLTIDSGTVTEPYVLSLIVTDSARYLPQLIALNEKPVHIQELLVVCER